MTRRSFTAVFFSSRGTTLVLFTCSHPLTSLENVTTCFRGQLPTFTIYHTHSPSVHSQNTAPYWLLIPGFLSAKDSLQSTCPSWESFEELTVTTQSLGRNSSWGIECVLWMGMGSYRCHAKSYPWSTKQYLPLGGYFSVKHWFLQPHLRTRQFSFSPSSQFIQRSSCMHNTLNS